MARRNEAACDMWYMYQSKMGYPALVSREKAAKILGISKTSVGDLISRGSLTIDKTSNKVKLYSIAEYQCS